MNIHPQPPILWDNAIPMPFRPDPLEIPSRPMDPRRDDAPTTVSKPVLSYRQTGGNKRRQPRLTLRRRLSNASEASAASNQPTVGTTSQPASPRPRLTIRRGRTSRPTANPPVSEVPSQSSMPRSTTPTPDSYEDIPEPEEQEDGFPFPVVAPPPPDPRSIFGPRVFAPSHGVTPEIRTSSHPRTVMSSRTPSDQHTNPTTTRTVNTRTVTFDSETEETSSCLSASTQATSVDSDGGSFRDYEAQSKPTTRIARPAPVTVRRPARTGTSVRSSRRNLHMEVLAAAQAQLQDIQSQRRGEQIESLKQEAAELAGHHDAIAKELEDAKKEISTLLLERDTLLSEKNDLLCGRESLLSDKEAVHEELEAQKAVTDTIKRELDEHSQMLDELRRSVDEKDRALTDSQAERDLFREAKNAFEERCIELEKDLTAVRDGRRDHEALLIAQVAELEMTRDALQGRADTLVAELKGKEEDSTKLSEECDRLKSEIEKRNDQIASHAGEMATLEEERKGIQSKVDELESEKGELAAKIETLEGEKKDLQAQIEELEGKKPAFESKVEGLEAEKKELTSQLDALEAEKTELQAQIAALVSDRDELKGEVTALTEKTADQDSEISKLEDDLKAAEANAAQLEEDNRSLLEEKEQSKVSDESGETEDPPAPEASEPEPEPEPEAGEPDAAESSEPDNSELDDLKRQHQELEAKLADLEGQHAAAQEEIDNLKEEAEKSAALSVEKADLEAKAAKMEEDLQDVPVLREQNAGLLGQLETARQRIEELGAMHQAAGSEVGALRAQIAQLQSRLSTAPPPSEAGSVASSKKSSKSGKLRGKGELVVVRSRDDRGVLQIMRKSEFYRSRSRSPSQAGDESG